MIRLLVGLRTFPDAFLTHRCFFTQMWACHTRAVHRPRDHVHGALSADAAAQAWPCRWRRPRIIQRQGEIEGLAEGGGGALERNLGAYYAVNGTCSSLLTLPHSFSLFLTLYPPPIPLTCALTPPNLHNLQTLSRSQSLAGGAVPPPAALPLGVVSGPQGLVGLMVASGRCDMATWAGGHHGGFGQVGRHGQGSIMAAMKVFDIVHSPVEGIALAGAPSGLIAGL